MVQRPSGTAHLDSRRDPALAFARRAAAFAPHPDRRHLRLGRGRGNRRRRLGLGQRAERDGAAASRARSAARLFRWRADGVRPAARARRAPPTSSASGRRCARSPTARRAATSTSRTPPAAVPARSARPTAAIRSRSSSPATASSPRTHLGGYSGGDGLATKRWLLALEARAQPLLQPIPSAAA